MSNITDYIKWRGDLSFSEKPLSDIDNVVFCYLSYIDYTDFFQSETLRTDAGQMDALAARTEEAAASPCKQIKIKDLASKPAEEIVFKFIMSMDFNIPFVEAAAASKRFGEIIVEDYVQETDPASNIQFSAVTFVLDDGSSVVAFRGTDETIVGWKEDFMLSYTRVPAQEKALEYLRMQAKKRDNLYVVGHSKGGNLALYATAYLTEKENGKAKTDNSQPYESVNGEDEKVKAGEVAPGRLQDKIKKIYLNDSPGFCSEILDVSLIDIIADKCVRYTPDYCVVGHIFEPKVPVNYIVKSNGKQLLAHDMMSWEISDGSFEYVSDYIPESKKLNSVLDKLIEKMDSDARESFVNSLFDAMSEGGAVTIMDFAKKGPAAFENVITSVVSGKGAGTYILNNVRQSIVDELGKKKGFKNISKGTRAVSAIHIAIMVVLGVLCLVIPENFLQAFLAVLAFASTVFEVVITLIHLKKSQWNLKKERLRVSICVLMIVAFTLLIVKEDALFLVTSAAFGSAFLLCAYQCAIVFKNNKGDLSVRIRFALEGVVAIILGLYILVVPNINQSIYTISCGVVFLIDALLEIIHLLRKL
ncbi:MAG: DUF2974 domain-containing protein [Lachnospiraceae bacterium]|nr:DUF2974 domain-containing protein [Lachnospiraceae bacterium]